MRLKLLQFVRAVRASYWFIPSLMVLMAIVLGATAVWLDSGPAAGLFDDVAWYQKSKPSGAREVLSTIAGSMITVAGVVFSITIVAISFAANQYGPRILTNFMSDRGNQVTLGTFIATFVYCLVVLRTIYSGEDGFVPQLAVFLGLLLAFCSIAVLIYFIHHVPQSIQVNHVLARIGRHLIDSVERRFPATFGEAPEQSGKEVEKLERLARSTFADGGDWLAVDCQVDGYLQAVDDSRMMSTARDNGLIVKLERSPGEFLYRGLPLVLAYPAGRVTEDICAELRSSSSVGSNRTPGQDQMFLIDELVEVAARALSTGVNDPYTAITCIDWLTAAIAELARRRTPSPYRLDEDGNLRVIAPTDSFERHVERGFGRLRPYAAADVNAATHFLAQLGSAAEECRSAEHVQCLSREADALVGLAKSQHRGASLTRIEEAAAKTDIAIAEQLARLRRHSPNG